MKGHVVTAAESPRGLTGGPENITITTDDSSTQNAEFVAPVGGIQEFTAVSLAKLTAAGIAPEQAGALGITAVTARAQLAGFPRFLTPLPGMLFSDPGNAATAVYRPDSPVTGEDGKLAKYVARSGMDPALVHYRRPAAGKPWLLVEGQLQQRAAALYAPADWGVTGMPGCWGFRGTDLSMFGGYDVCLVPDADVTTNRDVHDAMTELWGALAMEDTASVALVRLLGAATKDGLDDVLGRRREDDRTAYLERLVGKALDRMPRRPAKRKESAFFDETGSLLALTLANKATADHPAALAGDSGVIALYRDGVFRIDPVAFRSAVSTLLGEDSRPVHVAAVEQVVTGKLFADGTVIPDRVAEPLLNCANGMLNLLTGELLTHDPAYLSRSQSPVPWLPDAVCPRYTAWLEEMIPGQMDDLEETASQMLDQSRTPSKALFNFGPSRSGKSTFLRILEAIAGVDNVCAVSLHDLSDNKFAAAGVYGKALNTYADLSPKDVKDLALFKMMTGDDTITGEHKYGQRFKFRSSALFAFSANALPHVSEVSAAYTERIKPFRWGKSFAGHENPDVETAIMSELPGILVRLVTAWQRKARRGAYLPTDPAVMAEFTQKSDRVAHWVSEYCTVAKADPRTTLPMDRASTITELFKAFSEIQLQDGGSNMGKTTFAEKLRSVPGVVGVYLPSRSDGLNVVFHGVTQDECGDAAALEEMKRKQIKIVERSEQSFSPPRYRSGTDLKISSGEVSHLHVEERENSAHSAQRSSAPDLPDDPFDVAAEPTAAGTELGDAFDWGV